MNNNQNISLRSDETIDDLQYKGLVIIQKNQGFKFGIDAVLLANFVQVKKNDLVLDIGTGTGIIPILLSGKTQACKIVGIEIQQEMAEMARRSVELNGLGGRVEIIHGDIKKGNEYFTHSSFNVVVSNPPYMKKGGGLLNLYDSKAIARHEIACTLEDIIKEGSRVVANKGRLAMVHRPERMVDVVYLMRKYAIEPKLIRFIHPYENTEPNLFLIQGIKGGNPGLKIQKPLYIYENDGELRYSDEINKIYNRS
jgi:tRNA1Val (adenine37-N6)-methyltransferase